VKSLSLSSSLIISRKTVLGIAPLMLLSCRATREQEACVQYADHREPPLHILFGSGQSTACHNTSRRRAVCPIASLEMTKHNLDLIF
jgi:hypothetical protein